MQKTKIGWATHSSNPIYAVNRETGKRGWFCTHVSAVPGIRDKATTSGAQSCGRRRIRP